MKRAPKAESVPTVIAPSSRDIEARRSALQRELWEVGHRLGMPTSDAQRARNDRMAELQAQLDALPQPEPRETGEAAGSIAIGHFLGSPWQPPPREPSEADRRREEDPFARFAEEMGWERS
jgi:hypothetical protein